MASGTEAAGSGHRTAGLVDRGLYALFSRHADSVRHARDRQQYRAAALDTGFDVYLSRVYGLAWAGAVVAGLVVFGGALILPAGSLAAVADFLASGLPILNRLTLPVPPRFTIGLGGGLVASTAVRFFVVRIGSQYLRWAADARRDAIEHTLPGAVRYLRVLASGCDNPQDLLGRVADQDAYGATADAFRQALNEAALTGSLETGLARVARESPSRELLSPFLLKFKEHAAQGSDSLEGYLRMEGRLLSHRQSRVHERASGYLELVAELFVVLLVCPALAVLVLTMASVLAPGLSREVSTPLGRTTARALFVYLSVAFVLVVGAVATWLVAHIRPTGQSRPDYTRPTGLSAAVQTAFRNPSSAATLAVPVGVAVIALLWSLGYRPTNAVLLGYGIAGIPPGLVAVRRAALDDAKDREIRDFVHAVSGHVGLGRPFPAAVQRVAREVNLGALQPDVDALAFNLGVTTHGPADTDVQAAALERFVDRVGTPLAAQTIGLVVGALDAGSSTENVFETLETEIGRLYHERKALRSRLLVYVAVGWATALLVVGIVLAVNATVVDGFAQLSTVADATNTMALDPDAVDPARDRWRFYLVTQATVLACGWFAGMASRGRYEAALHSGILVVLTYVLFAGTGML